MNCFRFGWTLLFCGAFALALPGCGGKSTDTGEEADTDTDTDADTDTDTDTDCETALTSLEPTDGAANWYWQEALTLVFDGPATDAAIAVADGEGTDIALSVTWNKTEEMATVAPVDGFTPSSTHTLSVDICTQSVSTEFATSAYGSELEEGAAALVGNTYSLEFSDVTITEPATAGALLKTFLTEPLLIGVASVDIDAETIELVAAQGIKLNSGSYEQDTDVEAWLFPASDFSNNPFFESDADQIELTYTDIAIPVDGFHLEGTFAADGSSFGEGKLSGLVDTRYLHDLFGSDKKTYVCDLGFNLGIECEACSDGEEYCIYLQAEDILSEIVDGVTLEY